jgi:hypothetical protein
MLTKGKIPKDLESEMRKLLPRLRRRKASEEFPRDNMRPPVKESQLDGHMKTRRFSVKAHYFCGLTLTTQSGQMS